MIGLLEDQNPWWIHEEDPELKEFKKLRYRITPKWIEEISLQPFSLNFILGPRRVGKTLGMKLLIKNILKNSKNPYSVFYFDCSILENYKELVEIMEAYFKIRRRKGVRSSYIFLDEVTLLPDWWRGVKYLIDRKKFIEDVLTVTGSITLARERIIGAFGGRMGRGRIIEVTPLSFREYYHLFSQEFARSKASEIFENYLETGGYLAYLNGMLTTKDVILTIKSDILTLGKSTSIARDVIGAIIDVAPDPVSFRKLGERSGVSVPTVREYIEVFEALHILLQIPFRDEGGRIIERKDRKFIIRDPLIARALAEWAGREIGKEVLYEWIVQEHLYRKFGEVFYFRTDKYEIDAVAKGIKIEVKSGRIKRKYPRDVMVIGGEEIPEFLYNLT
ncbi:ATP-binding protein [Pyrococcus kukulkanii]|uniref:ATP-binding protein n=1 Tax=Pyrococcus kukulkanii TaxID=1609559 RepID=UPI0035634AE0